MPWMPGAFAPFAPPLHATGYMCMQKVRSTCEDRPLLFFSARTAKKQAFTRNIESIV